MGMMVLNHQMTLNSDSIHKLVHDLICAWHETSKQDITPTVHRERIDNSALICNILTEFESKESALPSAGQNIFYEDWAGLTWNLLSIIMRIFKDYILCGGNVTQERREILNKSNSLLVNFVNKTRPIFLPASVEPNDPRYQQFLQLYAESLNELQKLYSLLNSINSNEIFESFMARIRFFGSILHSCLKCFEDNISQHGARLWKNLREAQAECMNSSSTLNFQLLLPLMDYYTSITYALGILTARLQVFRYEAIIVKKLFLKDDCIEPLIGNICFTLERLLVDCVLATEPSTNPILVTNNLFPMQCGAPVRGIIFYNFQVQIVSEETAAKIQIELQRIKISKLSSVLGNFSSAALLATKPASGVKRNNSRASVDGGNTAHKKSDVNSKESVFLQATFHNKYKFWLASYPHLLCTTRQKDTTLDSRAGQIGKRPLFYFYIRASIFGPNGNTIEAHTLSLPFTIATRRNQDCQVQRMMSSYTATCFWLYGNNVQNNFLFTWTDDAISEKNFKLLCSQYFAKNADVKRGLDDCDFDMLLNKIRCCECNTNMISFSDIKQGITFKNLLCPHLYYDFGSMTVSFSVWRGILELLQIFQDQKCGVRQLWESSLIFAFISVERTCELLEMCENALCMRLSFLNGGSICFSMKSRPTFEIIHLEPLDLKRLQSKPLIEYLRDVAAAEKIRYLMTASNNLVPVSQVLSSYKVKNLEDKAEVKEVTSNVAHEGTIESTDTLRFTVLRTAVLTCRTNQTSENSFELENSFGQEEFYHRTSKNTDFTTELTALMTKYKKCPKDVIEILTKSPSFSSFPLSNYTNQN